VNISIFYKGVKKLTLFERVSELAAKHQISLKELSENLGLSQNAIYQWRTSSPKAETVAKIANYFNVSTDYLLGVENNDNSIISHFRAETANMSEEDLEELEEEINEFTAILIERAKRKLEKDGKK
jgi:transcriptional regulator with XRE-family HTH domain